jgi:GT2 family glycosyltransferase
VFGVNAAAAMYTRNYIDEQPNHMLFDEKFYMYLEDMDVSLRAIVTGWNNYYIPTARAYHMGSMSAKKRSNTYYINMTFRNQSALLFKNLPFKTIIRFLPKAIKFDMHFYIHLKRTHGIRVMGKALIGRTEGLLRLPLYVNDRLRIRRQAKRGSAEIERIMRQKGIF